MTDLDSYETMGDPDDDRPMTKKDAQRQATREEINEAAKKFVADAPPMTDETVETIRRLLFSGRKASDHEIMRWRLRLFCGHVIEKTQHVSDPRLTYIHGPCPECGRDPVAVVASRPLGLVAELPPPPPKPKVAPRDLKRHLAKAKAEVERLERELRE